ncbi:MAG: hypothetical protein ABSB81_01960 [Halobacteriota archaeon]|jgi:hypothetical protein
MVLAYRFTWQSLLAYRFIDETTNRALINLIDGIFCGQGVPRLCPYKSLP